MSVQAGSGYTAAEFVETLLSNWIETSCTAAASALVIYDHLTTLRPELRLFWGKPLTPIRLLFHLNRWTLIFWATFSVHSTFSPGGNYTSCVIVAGVDAGFNILLMTIWAVFSAIRVHAISGQTWWMTGVAAVLSMNPVAITVFQLVTQHPVQELNVPLLGWTCITSLDTSASVLVDIMIRVCFIASDLFVLFVTGCKTWTLARNNRTFPAPFATMLLRNGIVYFIAMLFFHVVNIVGYGLSDFWSPGFYLVSRFLNPVMSIMISHYHLNLRRMAY
ncbi:hypothetical protein CERSUDRAFT_88631, partial [Gelatoporia subvermispora B]